MALIEGILTALFGPGRNILRETAEVFRENAEAQARREGLRSEAALGQFASEFGRDASGRGRFDRLMDGVNRVPRPAMALGTLGLFVAAMVDPVWFASRMQGIALVPEPLWWLLGVIVSFYFGARYQAKGQEFQTRIAETMGRVPQVVENLETLREVGAQSPNVADSGTDATLTLETVRSEDNPALAAWRRELSRK